MPVTEPLGVDPDADRAAVPLAAHPAPFWLSPSGVSTAA